MTTKKELLYPNSMREAQELGYMFTGVDDCFLNGGEFVSDGEMKWEGEMQFDLGAEGDHSDGNLGPIKVRVRATFTFEQIEPTE